MSSDTTRQVVDALNSRLRELDSEASHIRALLAHYGVAKSPVQPAAATPIASRSRSAPAAAKAQRVSTQWRPLWDMMVEHGDDIHLDALVAFDESYGLGRGRDKIRNHMHNWKRQGLVVSTKPLVYRAINPETSNDAEPEASASLSETESRNEPETHEVVRFDLLHHNAAETAGGGT